MLVVCLGLLVILSRAKEEALMRVVYCDASGQVVEIGYSREDTESCKLDVDMQE